MKKLPKTTKQRYWSFRRRKMLRDIYVAFFLIIIINRLLSVRMFTWFT